MPGVDNIAVRRAWIVVEADVEPDWRCVLSSPGPGCRSRPGVPVSRECVGFLFLMETDLLRQFALKTLRGIGSRTLWKNRPHKPTFLVIGAQKCGTTSLHAYLNQHPLFFGSNPKELHYFDEKIHFGATREWYEGHFRGPEGSFYFESSPGYLYRPGVCEQIHAYDPDMRFIVLLRDPVKRAYSAYNHYRYSFDKGESRIERQRLKKQNRPPGIRTYEEFFENRTSFPGFREALDIELKGIVDNAFYDPALLRRGIYIDQLEKYWRLFGEEKVCVIGFNEFIRDPCGCLARLSRFVGAGEIDWCFIKQAPRNVKPYKDRISDEDKAFLESFYEPHNARLFQKMGPIDW